MKIDTKLTFFGAVLTFAFRELADFPRDFAVAFDAGLAFFPGFCTEDDDEEEEDAERLRPPILCFTSYSLTTDATCASSFAVITRCAASRARSCARFVLTMTETGSMQLFANASSFPFCALHDVVTPLCSSLIFACSASVLPFSFAAPRPLGSAAATNSARAASTLRDFVAPAFFTSPSSRDTTPRGVNEADGIFENSLREFQMFAFVDDF